MSFTDGYGLLVAVMDFCEALWTFVVSYGLLDWKSGLPVDGSPLLVYSKSEGFSLDGEGADDVGDE